MFFFFLFGSEEAVNICENLCVTMFRFFFAFDIMTLRQGSVHKILVRPFSPDPYPCPIVSGLFSKDYLWWNFSALRSDPIPRTRILWMPPNGNTTSKNYILRTLVNDEISNSNFIALLLVLFGFFLSWMPLGGFELFRIFSFSLH